jgi:hypothetical protein
MSLTCPNKSHPDYKAAVELYGEDRAIQMFIDNKGVIPKIASDNNQTGYEFGKTTYPTSSTLSLLSQNPKLASKIIDSLKRLYPDVIINKGGIIDENGKYKSIAPGEKGMHIRNAFQSMVAWANDAYLETPPHEYAHHYIEMYYNSPVIQEGIKRYGSIEELATMMGRYYAKKKMSPWFTNWANKFWNFVKSLVGSPDINYQLGEAFMQNKNLGAIEAGLATVNYQQAQDQVRVRYADGADFSSLTKFTPSTNDNKIAAVDFIRRSGAMYESAKDIAFNIVDNINKFKTKTSQLVAGQRVYKNIVDERYINDVVNWIRQGEGDKFDNIAKLVAFATGKNIGNKLTFDKGKTKDVLSLNQERKAKLVQEIIDNKKLFKGRTKDGKLVELDSGIEYEYYYNTETKKDYKRLTTHLSDDGSPDITNPIIKSALEIGTKVDVLTRDFFAGNLKSDLSEYNIGDEQMVKDFLKSLESIKAKMDKRGEKVLANDIILYDNESGIAGTVDLLTYDKDGNFRIYDMKTMRGNQFEMTHQSGENQGKNKYDTPYRKGKLSNKEKHQRQLSGYRIMLNNTHGIDAKTLGVLPIEVDYKGGDTETTVLKSLKGYEHEAINEVFDPTMLDFTETENIPDTTPDGKEKIIDIIGQIQNAQNHIVESKSNLILNDGTFTSLEDVVDEVQSDIIKAKQKKDAIYSKVKNKHIRKFLKWLERVMKYQRNLRLDAKYLSGGENNLLYKFSYQVLNRAESLRNKLIIDFNKLLLEDTFSEKYSNWSYYKNKGAELKELNTESFEAEMGDKTVNVPLTKAEMLGVYLMNRQKRASEPMARHGIILNDNIEGRDLPYNRTIKLSEETIQKISDSIANDPEFQKVIKNIDAALTDMSTKVGDAFRKENGIDLRLEDNYFPVYAGKVSFDQRRGKSSINDFRSLNLSLDENKPIRIVDPIQVLNSYKVSSASYVALSLPIQNIRKIIKSVESDYKGTQEEAYIENIKEVVNKLEDPTQLYSGQGEKDWEKTVNKITNTFGVSVLGMNVPVMLKQSVSYITAMEAIDSKYLTKAGGGTKFLPVINPKQILEAIEWTGTEGGVTKLPIEWNLDTNKGVFALMKKYSPDLEARLDGLVNRELGEALMNQDANDDMITIPGFKKKDGSAYRVSKNRLMEGIRVFDAVTIANIWKAAEFEAEEKYGLSRGTEKFNQHVAIRVEEIIARTQPNFNLTDRSSLSTSQSPIARFFTMFSSATQKIAMLQIEGVIDYIQNPTKENKVKLIKRSANLMLTTGLVIATIDTLKGALIYGWDDDDDLFKAVGLNTAVNSLGVFYGVGQLARVVGSQLDDKPFYQTLQHPFELMAQDLAMAMANLAKGNLDDAAIKGFEITLKRTGLPLFPFTSTRQLVKRIAEDNK